MFPHLSVEANIGYPLFIKRKSREHIQARVNSLLEELGLAGFGERHPNELSGGEAQRVAIARAIADPQPILLLDEIQSGLDRHLQASMRETLIDLTRKLGVTIFYVTHDAKEALSMASVLDSRLAILDDGVVVQVGKAAEIYFHPQTPFVASFLGDINLLPSDFPSGSAPESKELKIGIRPEHIFFTRSQVDSFNFSGIVYDIEFIGAGFNVRVKAGTQTIKALVRDLPEGLALGIAVECFVPRANIIRFDKA